MEFCETATDFCLQNSSSRNASVSKIENLYGHPPRFPFLLSNSIVMSTYLHLRLQCISSSPGARRTIAF